MYPLACEEWIARGRLMVCMALIAALPACTAPKTSSTSFLLQQSSTAADSSLPPQRIETVQASRLHMRARPSANARVVGVLSKGMRVALGKQEGEWVNVRGPDQRTGWVSTAYLSGFDQLKRMERRQLSSDAKSQKRPAVPKETRSVPKQTGTGESEGRKTPQPDNEHSESVDQELGELAKSLKEIHASEIQQGRAPSSPTPADNSQVEAQPPSEPVAIKADAESAKEPVETEASQQTQPEEARDRSSGDVVSLNDTTTHTVVLRGQKNQKAIGVREAPDFLVGIKMWLPPDTPIEAYGTEGDWYKVKTDQGVGYIHKKFVEEVDPRSMK